MNDDKLLKRILKLSLNNEDTSEEKRQYHLLMEKYQIISRNMEVEIASLKTQIEDLAIREKCLLEELSNLSLQIEDERQICIMKAECNAMFEELQRKPPFKTLKECVHVDWFY